MIRMLVGDMLTDLGHTVAAEAGRLDEAVTLARQAQFDLALLDVSLAGEEVTPVAEILVQRRVPFVFASGYGPRGVPAAYRHCAVLQKPFQIDALAEAIASAAPLPSS